MKKTKLFYKCVDFVFSKIDQNQALENHCLEDSSSCATNVSKIL